MLENVRNARVTLGEDGFVDMLYRPGTRDIATIQDIWTKHPYRLSVYGNVQGRKDIEELYAAMVAAGKTPLILDLGANIGASALAFRRYYPAARIIAIEPEADNFDLLRRNTRDADVMCVRGAVAAFDGKVELRDPGRSTDAYRTGEADGAVIETVPALSVDTLMSIAGGAPLLAKIDIEGAEKGLFAENTGWVDRFPCIAIELHDWMLAGQASSSTFLQCVGALGRDFINPEATDIVFSLRNPRGAEGASWAG